MNYLVFTNYSDASSGHIQPVPTDLRSTSNCTVRSHT